MLTLTHNHVCTTNILQVKKMQPYHSMLLSSLSKHPPYAVTVVLFGPAIRKMDQGWHTMTGFEC